VEKITDNYIVASHWDYNRDDQVEIKYKTRKKYRNASLGFWWDVVVFPRDFPEYWPSEIVEEFLREMWDKLYIIARIAR